MRQFPSELSVLTFSTLLASAHMVPADLSQNGPPTAYIFAKRRGLLSLGVYRAPPLSAEPSKLATITDVCVRFLGAALKGLSIFSKAPLIPGSTLLEVCPPSAPRKWMVYAKCGTGPLRPALPAPIFAGVTTQTFISWGGPSAEPHIGPPNLCHPEFLAFSICPRSSVQHGSP